jgi:hypothetical protein
MQNIGPLAMLALCLVCALGAMAFWIRYVLTK